MLKKKQWCSISWHWLTGAFPMHKSDLRIFVKSYLDKKGRQVKLSSLRISVLVRNGHPRLWEGTDSRWQTRVFQNISCKQAEVSRATITKYFDNLQESLNGDPSENIINYDEMNLTDNPWRKHSIFRRGVKYPDRVMNSAKASTSLFAALAAGELLPVYVVYKSEHIWCGLRAALRALDTTDPNQDGLTTYALQIGAISITIPET